MAPEFLRNSKPSSKTDVYAFGVVMLELFTGQAADDPSRDIRTLVSIINNDYTGFQCIVDPYTYVQVVFPFILFCFCLEKNCKYMNTLNVLFTCRMQIILFYVHVIMT